jgi:hypothetical protein
LQAAERRSLENKYLAERTPVSALSVSDLASTISDLLQEQRADLIGHMNRLYKLANIKAAASASEENERGQNLHARLCAVESAIRALQRGKSR